MTQWKISCSETLLKYDTMVSKKIKILLYARGFGDKITCYLSDPSQTFFSHACPGSVFSNLNPLYHFFLIIGFVLGESVFLYESSVWAHIHKYALASA